jgi:uncharacterized membrane protein YfcA
MTPLLLVSITLVFVLAGAVKGVSGMGLPTVAMGLLGLLLAPAEAASLLLVPSLVTNVWQFVAGPHRAAILRRTWRMLLAIAVATVAATGLIAGADTRATTAVLGAALLLYAALGLGRAKLSVPAHYETPLAPLVGAATGIVTGATGVLVLPAVPWLQALDLDRDELIQALGLSFTTSTLALAAGLALHGALRPDSAGLSLLCTLPALGGMWLGQSVRRRISPASFRLVFFVGLLALGAELLIRGLV